LNFFRNRKMLIARGAQGDTGWREQNAVEDAELSKALDFSWFFRALNLMSVAYLRKA
jgi:hypothetical protein